MYKLVSKPFDWNDNLSEEAQEVFEDIRPHLSYGACQVLGMALAKLELLEKQGAKYVNLVQNLMFFTVRIVGKGYVNILYGL